MKSLEWVSDETFRSSYLLRCALIALFLEGGLLTAIGWHEHWLAHPSQGNEETQFIEAQVFQMPTEEARLVEDKPAKTRVSRSEATLSKSPSQGVKSKTPVTVEEENKTESGPKMAPTHGPVPLYAPEPTIPGYLRNQVMKASVVVEFLISSQGAFHIRLISSSGNEELDAAALATLKKWQFRPAEQDHKAIDSKVRLRIVFKVE